MEPESTDDTSRTKRNRKPVVFRDFLSERDSEWDSEVSQLTKKKRVERTVQTNDNVAKVFFHIFLTLQISILNLTFDKNSLNT